MRTIALSLLALAASSAARLPRHANHPTAEPEPMGRGRAQVHFQKPNDQGGIIPENLIVQGDWKLHSDAGFDLGLEYNVWKNLTSAPLSVPEVQLYHHLRQLHPDHALVVTRDPQFQIFNFAASPENLARLRFLPTPSTVSSLIQKIYIPPERQSAGPGGIVLDVIFGSFEINWASQNFVAYLYKWQEDFSRYSEWFIFHKDKDNGEEIIDTLMLAVGSWGFDLHDETLVFDMYWQKDASLWVDIQHANWEDVILDEDLKSSLRNDVVGFFKKGDVYKRLGVPYKRGIILLGPPGNGKTITVKALMKEVSQVTPSIPSLYVKSFRSWTGDEGGMRDVFEMARMRAPCLLILEDLDSLITNQSRSFFLNQLDGLASNDGVFLIGTTNHFDRLDDALKHRPSRFDRKYNFPDPPFDERVAYARYWQNKLAGEESAPFPDVLVIKFAEHTDGFSFAFMKEAFLSTLLYLAGLDQPSPDLFEVTLFKQVQQLREELGREDLVILV